MPPHESHGLLVACLLLAAAMLAPLLARLLRVTPIVGYLAIGALIGPHATGLVEDSHQLRFVAEFGVAFLLFDIGLHFSLKSLWQTRHQLFGLGPLFWLLATAPLAGLLWSQGIGAAGAFFLGGALALSSTAVVLSAFADRGERDTPLGRTITAVLIFQDLAAVLLLAAIGSFTAASARPGVAIVLAVGKIVIAFAGVAMLGRAVRPLFRRIVKHEDEATFVSAALLLVTATAGVTAASGLSLALGAFLAGMALSESEYCYRVKTEIRPFRGLLLGLFFLTVGMSLDLAALIASPALALGLLGAIVAVKGVAGVLAARLLRQPFGFATRIGLSLAQGSEFAFVIGSLLLAAGLIPNGVAAATVVAVVLSMVLTAPLISVGDRLGRAAEARWRGAPVTPDGDHASGPRVLINGLGPAGRAVARALSAQQIEHLALETDPDRLDAGRADGFHVAYGDPWSFDLLRTLGISSARALILGEARGAQAIDLIARVRREHPGLPVLVRAVDGETAAGAAAAGADVCVKPTTVPTELAMETLRRLGVTDEDARRWRDAFEPSPYERADKAHQWA